MRSLRVPTAPRTPLTALTVNPALALTACGGTGNDADAILVAYSGLTQQDYDSLSETAEENPELEGKSAMFLTQVDSSDLSEVSFYTTHDPRTAFFNDLGLETPESGAETSDGTEEFSQTVSAEPLSEADERPVAAALEATHAHGLVDRPVDELSGGQRQRVWIALVLDLLTELNHNVGTTMVMVLHDLNIAARYADHLVAIVDGTVHSAGTPHEVLTAQSVRSVFGLDSLIITDPVSNQPLMVPMGRHHRTDHPPHPPTSQETA